nr:transcriptional regulator [Telluribacter sp. SYSU D00476]
MENVKEYLKDINKDFESRARLGIMSVLMVEESVDFNFLKETLQLTDGNLASHLRALEEAAYLRVEKQFVGRKPNTRYQATPAGKEAFRNHLDALERLILDNRNP